MQKRSITIAGHRTSLSLEDAFWAELKLLADRQGRTLAQLVTDIDKDRDLGVNLSSALRLYVLQKVKAGQA